MQALAVLVLVPLQATVKELLVLCVNKVDGSPDGFDIGAGDALVDNLVFYGHKCQFHAHRMDFRGLETFQVSEVRLFFFGIADLQNIKPLCLMVYIVY